MNSTATSFTNYNGEQVKVLNRNPQLPPSCLQPLPLYNGRGPNRGMTIPVTYLLVGFIDGTMTAISLA